MDIKKTDIFSGIGVFIIQMIANGIWYAFQKNNIYLVIGIIFAIIISVFIVIIIGFRRKLKKQEELVKFVEDLKGEIADLEHERNDIVQEIDKLEQDVELFNNKCEYYMGTDSVNRKILYSLKNKKKCESTELQGLIAEIEYIFRDDMYLRNAKMNTSIFTKNTDGLCSILISTKHSPGTVSKLRLNNDSLVGTAFNEKRLIYCGDIDNRRPEIPFIELDGNRQYQSILAIPLVVDDTAEFVLVITCTKRDCLEETYKKYQDVIQRYLELLCILLFISSDKEEL